MPLVPVIPKICTQCTAPLPSYSKNSYKATCQFCDTKFVEEIPVASDNANSNICGYCNGKLLAKAEFCGKCGFPIPKKVATTEPINNVPTPSIAPAVVATQPSPQQTRQNSITVGGVFAIGGLLGLFYAVIATIVDYARFYDRVGSIPFDDWLDMWLGFGDSGGRITLLVISLIAIVIGAFMNKKSVTFLFFSFLLFLLVVVILSISFDI